jgi:hypothetical protein
LIDATNVRQRLRQDEGLDLALIVSATVYDEVVASRLRGLRPEAFRRVVVRTKGSAYIGYLAQDPIEAELR